MEEVHYTHKETAWDWLGDLIRIAPRVTARPRSTARAFKVTPWSGRSPKGWSA